jgi:hypothetical protein
MVMQAWSDFNFSLNPRSAASARKERIYLRNGSLRHVDAPELFVVRHQIVYKLQRISRNILPIVFSVGNLRRLRTIRLLPG